MTDAPFTETHRETREEAVRRASEGCEGPLDNPCFRSRPPRHLWCDPCRLQELVKAIDAALAEIDRLTRRAECDGWRIEDLKVEIDRLTAIVETRGVVLQKALNESWHGGESEKRATPDVLMRIQEYIGNGGLFNPDLMDHDKVRDLVVDCRGAIQAALAEIDRLRKPQVPPGCDCDQPGTDPACHASDCAWRRQNPA